MNPSVRFYTLPEANAKVPALEKDFARIEQHLERARELHDQVNDIEIVWGAKLLEPSCPDRVAYLEYKGALEAEEAAVHEITTAITTDGIEIKDLGAGLVDFYARRGQDVVYLCWKRGEKAVGFWHTLQGGFAARKPLGEF